MTDVVLAIWVVAAFVALCCRLLLLGAELSDLESLIARKRNGLTRIESIQHVRTELMWVIVALCFLVIGLLAWTVTAPWRGEVSRWLLLVPSVLMAIAPIWDWWDRRRKLRLTVLEVAARAAAADAARQDEQRSYVDIADEAVARLEVAATAARKLRGEPPLEPIAAVVPEHGSPVTPAQQATANLQTMRARLTAAVLGLEQEPRTTQDDGP